MRTYKKINVGNNVIPIALKIVNRHTLSLLGLLFPHLQKKWSYANNCLFNSLSSLQTNTSFTQLAISHHVAQRMGLPTLHSNDGEDLFTSFMVTPCL